MSLLSRRRGNHNDGHGKTRRQSLGFVARLVTILSLSGLVYRALMIENPTSNASPNADIGVLLNELKSQQLLSKQLDPQDHPESPELQPLTDNDVQKSSGHSQNKAHHQILDEPESKLSESVLSQAPMPHTEEVELSPLIGLPQRQATGTGFNTTDKKIIVVYSGPTHLVEPNLNGEPRSHGHKRIELYRLNFEYFLKHGVQCRTQDTLIVVTETVQQRYQPQIDSLHSQCQEHGHQVIMAIRNSTCWDLESVRRAMHDNVVNLDQYDYFVYINCGTSGPSKEWADLPWTNVLLEKLNDKVKMSGLTLNCNTGVPHIQSMVYALDRQGLQIIRESDAVFDCQKALETFTAPPGFPFRNEQDKMDSLIIGRYETGMGKILLDKGFGLASIVRPITVFKYNISKCMNEGYGDIWLVNALATRFGRVPRLDEIIFYKSSRVFPDHLAKEINYTLNVDWQWL